MVNKFFDLTPIEQLLCHAVADDVIEQRAEEAQALIQLVGEPKVFELTQANEATPQFMHALIATNEKLLTSPWCEAHQVMNQRIATYLSELDHIAQQFAEAGIALVVLKNGGIARALYPCLGCCPMGDLDVLVDKRHFRRAHQLLLEMGYQFEFRSPLEEANLSAAETGGGAEYWKILPEGEKLWLELQWRPVAGRWIRPDQEPSASELIAR